MKNKRKSIDNSLTLDDLGDMIMIANETFKRSTDMYIYIRPLLNDCITPDERHTDADLDREIVQKQEELQTLLDSKEDSPEKEEQIRALDLEIDNLTRSQIDLLDKLIVRYATDPGNTVEIVLNNAFSVLDNRADAFSVFMSDIYSKTLQKELDDDKAPMLYAMHLNTFINGHIEILDKIGSIRQKDAKAAATAKNRLIVRLRELSAQRIELYKKEFIFDSKKVKDGSVTDLSPVVSYLPSLSSGREQHIPVGSLNRKPIYCYVTLNDNDLATSGKITIWDKAVLDAVYSYYRANRDNRADHKVAIDIAALADIMKGSSSKRSVELESAIETSLKKLRRIDISLNFSEEAKAFQGKDRDYLSHKGNGYTLTSAMLPGSLISDVVIGGRRYPTGIVISDPPPSAAYAEMTNTIKTVENYFLDLPYDKDKEFIILRTMLLDRIYRMQRQLAAKREEVQNNPHKRKQIPLLEKNFFIIDLEKIYKEFIDDPTRYEDNANALRQKKLRIRTKLEKILDYYSYEPIKYKQMKDGVLQDNNQRYLIEKWKYMTKGQVATGIAILVADDQYLYAETKELFKDE